MKAKETLLIVFDIDDTLLSSDKSNNGHCKNIRKLWYSLKRVPNVTLHIVSGRLELDRSVTDIELKIKGIFCPATNLHLRPNGGMSDAQWKLEMAQKLQPFLIIDNSEVCRQPLIEAGFTYLKAPGIVG